ncbi:hypothetical protein P5673_005056 [Acropora cervicornis]|uniref:Uncharacterized protein n=1 Tax=Acropora cervicornis TaxID=6130 RepID=A0AAD9VDR1_ACRCE|nr:hypothetical protein P5673_005056 [Acropora cervicornis]
MGTVRNFAEAMLQFLIIAGCFQSSYSCSKIDNCSCKKSNGHIMSLHPIAGGKSGPKQGVITLECDRSKYPGEFITQFSQSTQGGVIQYEGCAFTFHTLASCCSSLLMRLKGESYAEI